MRHTILRAVTLALALTSIFTPVAHTQTVAFPDSPLQTSSSISVKPNLLFMLDDSGSMAFQYTPDYVSSDDAWNAGSTFERQCYDSGDNNQTGDTFGGLLGYNKSCRVGDPPFMAPLFNSQYYNPAIRYRPGVTATGTQYASQDSATTSGWTNVRTDAYNVTNLTMQGTSANYQNLLTGFPQRVWCTDQNDDPNSTSRCKANDTGYDYPNVDYPYGRDGTGTNSNVKYRYGAPYYWTIPSFERCTDADMRDCVVSATTVTQNGKVYSVPSNLRFCKYNGSATTMQNANLDLTDCQAKQDDDAKYVYPRFLGQVNPVAALQGAVAKIQFTTTPNVSQDITSITVDGQNIINGTLTGYNSRVNIAIAVAAAINAKIASAGQQEFRACAGSDCNSAVGINAGTDTVYVYPTTAPGSTTRQTGAATNNIGTPSVNGTAAGSGTRSRAVINVAALSSTGNPPVGGLTQVTAGGTNLFSSGVEQFNTPGNAASVAAQIAARINGGPANASFSATASGSSVTLERTTPGAFYDGQAVAFSYTGVARRAVDTFTVAVSGTSNKSVTIRLGSNASCTAGPATTLLNNYTSNTNNSSTYAANIVNNINLPTGFTISRNNANITINSDLSSDKNGWYLCFTTSGSITLPANSSFDTNGRSAMDDEITATAFSGGASNGPIAAVVTGFTGGSDLNAAVSRTGYAQWRKVTITGTNSTYAKSTSRTDCAGTVCTYAEEMTNFANWFTYHRTRMQTMKSAAGRSFSTLSDNFRVGFTTINDTSGGLFVKVRDFTQTQKTAWYSKFYSTGFNGGTPLRAALSRAGRIYSGINPLTTASNYEDPVQYSCQQNFIILTTDGYWNENSETAIKKEDGTRVDNVDGASGVATPFFDGGPGSCPVGGNCLGATCHGSTTDQGKFSSCNTLADVAFHFATTDLRRTDLDNCSNQSNSLITNLCTNNVKTTAKDSVRTQHMTTFALGLGVDGTLAFTDDYETAGSGDFAQIRAGTLKWPQVKNLHPTAVDDLWHAAVNGRGKYFSAKNPESLATGLNGALAEVNAQGGAGAAAATSNLEPITGDNYAYVASYTTVKWTGNLEARQIDLSTGEVSTAPQWCVEDVIDPVTNNISCTGTMSSLVQGGTDTRAIFTFDGSTSNKLKPFLYANLTTAQKAFFAPTGLSQYAALDTDSQAAATGENIVNYLRGQYQYEDRTANTVKAFRLRERTLADVIGSQPIYVKKPAFTYNDAGYAEFVAEKTTRAGSVYIGGNDGMLHSFNATTGVERWAYVPSPMLPKMRQLADYSYPTNHRFFVDGSPKVGDVQSGGTWRTILVGGYSVGGVGYYALDITDPATPKALWEFPPATELDAGYSYSAPIITKLTDGTWAVIVSSGYNNSGVGYMYVLNAVTGAVIRKVSTGVGTAASPSGLGRLTGYAPGMPYNNTTNQVYGGDLKGNLWRMNPSTGVVAKIAELKDPSGTGQPITTKPEVATVDTQVLIFVGTGKYLETTDLTSSQVQSFYAIRDTFDTNGTMTDPRSTLNKVTLTDTERSGGGFDRSSTGYSGNITTTRGWYADFPVTGERMNIDPQFVNGTVVALTNIPSNTACTAGGSSFINFFNFSNGKVLTGSSDLTNAIVVGFVVIKVGNAFIPLVTRSDSPNPQRATATPLEEGDTKYRGRRVSWKELNVD